MLVSIVAGLSEHAEVEVDRYGAWLAALRKLREESACGRVPIARLAEFLAPVPLDQQPEARQDLIAAHLTETWRNGPGAELEKYFEQLREGDDPVDSHATVPAESVEDELLARCQLPHGDLPGLKEYLDRFPNRPDIAELLRQRYLADERYVKLGHRGQGAMGEVFEAVDRHLRRLVALKLPRGDDQSLLHRFADEARLTASLEHPGIVGVHEFHEQGTPFYVMRLVNGLTLGERIRDYYAPLTAQSASTRQLEWQSLMQSFLAACDAIGFAHAAGVVHRDLKPGNIVIGSHGETVILDWGVGTRIDPATASAPDGAGGGNPPRNSDRLLAGTPEYMAPEQADGRADFRSDIFGLGAILYELLTARAPRGWTDGNRPADWPEQVRSGSVLLPRRLNRHAPRALETVCMKAMAHDPDRRYGSAADLALDIRRYLAHQPVGATTEPMSIRLLRRIGMQRRM